MAIPALTALPLSGDQAIDVMTTGYRWLPGAPIYYSLSGGPSGEFWLDPTKFIENLNIIFAVIGGYVEEDFSFRGFFEDPLTASISGSNINIAPESTYISQNYGNNTLAFAVFPNQLFAMSNYGSDYYPGLEGDIFVNISSGANIYGYNVGDQGFFLLLHEIGHALGLKHPHDSGGTGRPTFNELGIQGLDIDLLTIMSYNDNYQLNEIAWDPATPMILDVIALQYLYGVNTSHNSGDNTYSPVSGTNFYATWFDAGGRDVIDFRSYGAGVFIEMPNYIVSSTQYAPFGFFTPAEDPLAIDQDASPHELTWFLGTIEELIGTPFDDIVFGSDGDDLIRAGDGDDFLEPGLGEDEVHGGEGEDTGALIAKFQDCTISFDGDVCVVSSVLDGTNRFSGVELLQFDSGGMPQVKSVSSLKLADVPEPDMPTHWKLMATSNFVGMIGGRGQVFGTTGAEEIKVVDLPGNIVFDATFNRGGDTVYLEGAASIWSAAVRGSSAVLFDGDTFLQIPFGPSGISLVFDDGERVLRYDTSSKAVLVGGHHINEHYSVLASPSDHTGRAFDFRLQGSANLFIASDGVAVAGGTMKVFGTSGWQWVGLPYGHVQFDGSFNKGGDTIYLGQPVASFNVQISGSNANFQSDIFDVAIPVGPVGMELSFNGDARNLVYEISSSRYLIGHQEILTSPAPVFG